MWGWDPQANLAWGTFWGRKERKKEGRKTLVGLPAAQHGRARGGEARGSPAPAALCFMCRGLRHSAGLHLRCMQLLECFDSGATLYPSRHPTAQPCLIMASQKVAAALCPCLVVGKKGKSDSHHLPRSYKHSCSFPAVYHIKAAKAFPRGILLASSNKR